MKKPAFRKFIENYAPLTNADWQIIEQAFEIKRLKKNEKILREGDVCRHFWFLEKGVVRFFTNHDGDEITNFFTAAPYCFTSKQSFRNRTAAAESIQTLDETVVWQTNLEKVNRLTELKSWNIFTRKFIHEVQNYTEDLLLENKTQKAEERYKKLMQKHQNLVQIIPLNYLASFLGIAPQSLSRIRKKIEKKQSELT